MEGSSILSCSHCSSSSNHYSSRTHLNFTLHLSHPSYNLRKCETASLSFISNLRANKKRQMLMAVSSPSTRTSLRTSAFVIEKEAENSTKGKEMMPKIDKSGRFCSPRAARELALLTIYAACLEGSDPIRLFEKRMNARREPGYEFDKTSLLKYNHMSFGGPPVTTETVEEADELLRSDEKESAVEFCTINPVGRTANLIAAVTQLALPTYVVEFCTISPVGRSVYLIAAVTLPDCATSSEDCDFSRFGNKMLSPLYGADMHQHEAEVLSAPPKLVYSRLLLRFTRKLLAAVVDKWDNHVLTIDKVAPPNWKNEPAGRILEFCILHLAMSEIAVLGTRHQIVINEAIDLAKRFCDGAASRVINGCLRTFVKDLSGSNMTQASEANQKAEV